MTYLATAAPAAGQPTAADRDVLRKVLGASFIGNFVEWFDYASYGYFATVIAVAFFPEFAPASALLATFAVFAISFVIRPVGGIVWGGIGDRIGRRIHRRQRSPAPCARPAAGSARGCRPGGRRAGARSAWSRPT